MLNEKPFHSMLFASNFQEDFMTFEVKKALAGEDFDLKLKESFPKLSVSHSIMFTERRALRVRSMATRTSARRQDVFTAVPPVMHDLAK